MERRKRNKIGQNSGLALEIILHKAFIIVVAIFLLLMAFPWITLAIKSKSIKKLVFAKDMIEKASKNGVELTVKEFYDINNSLINGHILNVVLWFQNILILVTLLFLIIIFLFKKKSNF